MFDKLKTWVVEQVLWAETNMKDKSGAEKRQAVVDKLDALIPLPWFLEWMDGPLIGWLCDKACALLNAEAGHDWSGLNMTAEACESLAQELPDVDAYTRTAEEVASTTKETAQKTVETAKEAVTNAVETAKEVASNTAKAAVTGVVTASVKTATGDDKLSEHFSKKEFACRCGCGLCNPDPKLIEKLEKFRALCGGKPMAINSACRCEKHNKTVGGAAKSQHLYGKAADVRKILGLTIDQMAKKAEEAGFTGIGKYNGFVHVDVRATPARWDYRK